MKRSDGRLLLTQELWDFLQKTSCFWESRYPLRGMRFYDGESKLYVYIDCTGEAIFSIYEYGTDCSGSVIGSADILTLQEVRNKITEWYKMNDSDKLPSSNFNAFLERLSLKEKAKDEIDKAIETLKSARELLE